MNILRKLKKLMRLISGNIGRKINPPSEIRKNYKNWLIVYLEYSSLVLDLIEARFPSWLASVNNKVVFRNGLIIHKPVLFRHCGSFLAYNDYFSQYSNAFGEEVIIEDGDVVVDVGGHIGTFVLPLANKYPNLRLLAIEANPRNVLLLRKSVKANNMDNVEIIQGAVSNTKGEITFNLGLTSTTGFLDGIDFFMRSKGSDTVTVPAYTITDILKERAIESCKILKMDIEGAEYLALKGHTWILDITDNIMMELHEVDGVLPTDTELFKEIESRFDISLYYPSEKKGQKVVEIVGRKKSQLK